MPTEDAILKALDKPRTLAALLRMVDPGNRQQDPLQTLLMEMRDKGLVRFDINRGLWRRS